MGVYETLRSVCIGRGASGGRALPCFRRAQAGLIAPFHHPPSTIPPPPSTFHLPPALPARRRGFTLIELLVVILIIAILTSIGIGAFAQSRTIAWKQKARDTARQIALTWNARLIEDKGFPAAGVFTDLDALGVPDPNTITFQTTTTNMAVLNYLEMNADQRLNGMKDKWGNFFRVRLNMKGTGIIKSPLDGEPIRANVVAWSLGPYPNNPSRSWIVVWPE